MTIVLGCKEFGHVRASCPHILCDRCNQPGHFAQVCQNEEDPHGKTARARRAAQTGRAGQAGRQHNPLQSPLHHRDQVEPTNLRANEVSISMPGVGRGRGGPISDLNRGRGRGRTRGCARCHSPNHSENYCQHAI